MAKGQLRSTREAKKPKKDKVKTAAPTGSPFTTIEKTLAREAAEKKKR